MQLKHPEILWALLLLLIPILIHLFQLRRFKKTPFTNVAMLQKVVSESRKSNTLKKWLLLLTRMLVLAALVLAFAQPFSSKETALQEKETVVYLDNSFSMQAKTNSFSLLEKAVQDLVRNIDPESVFSLFTNERTYKDVTIKDIQNNLLSLSYSHKQLKRDEIQLKANTLFSKQNNSNKNLILISDFQTRMEMANTNSNSEINTYVVPAQPKETRNISIDSLFIEDNLSRQSTLNVYLSGGNSNENVPVSVYNGEQLIAKTAAEFEQNGKSEVVFSIPGNQEINGQLRIVDNSLSYDNQFFFNINKKELIKVMGISESNDDYLERLFTSDEFSFKKYALNQLDYSALDEQHVVILDSQKTIPNSLQKVFRTFKENGGTLIIVPAPDINLDSYNQFLSGFMATRFVENNHINKKITSISFEHPLYKNVFEKTVTNFQYPYTEQYYKIQSRAPKILALEGNDAFLSGIDGFYIFSSSLEAGNSNFKNSPLIVPTFYNMAAYSLKTPRSYYILANPNTLDIPVTIGNDNIIQVSKNTYEFIPLQQTFPNKVRLTFSENPTEDGIFTITNQGEPVQNISFNFPREESRLDYLDIDSMQDVTAQDSIASLFQFLKAENSITAYWKWFVILALLLVLVEVIIQKFVT
ncbi:BatA domain-containing protein [Flagellimonas eckloniae]|uniref:Membrane protein n=1 Tax=Flagellimonas eckloniae TaxID=346185 RepID=A0A0Q1DK54_9FLAO|nr:BatA domain-containing protein [Allomuricauda eckloniae]KQC29218.1 membrane protein [Allomuricauda eckloniae]